MSIASQAEQILDRVRAAGAEGDLIVDQGEALSLKAKDGALEEHKVTSSQVFGLRVIKDNRVGTAYSEAADGESLVALVDQALLNASYAAVEAHEKILANPLKLETQDAQLNPNDHTTVAEKIELALAIEARLAATPSLLHHGSRGPIKSANDALLCLCTHRIWRPECNGGHRPGGAAIC